MNEGEWLAARFEENRPRLKAVAYRMLGSRSEAEDAVQEAWLRLHRSDPDTVENLSGWLTTVVGRVCLDMLRSRTSRREDLLDEPPSASVTDHRHVIDPEQEVLLADSVGLALLVVLDTLDPAERLAFVLHDMFALPFDEIAPIVDRTPAAARQLASRARRRVRGAARVPEPDVSRQREIVDAFLAAARGGEFDALLTVLDPDVVLRADSAAVRAGATGLVRGASAVADTFSGRAQLAQTALVDGAVGAVWAPRGRPLVVFGFTITDEKISAIDLVAEPERLRRLDLAFLND
ncbi:sigma-70 family RNA polymerase sigma factor [Streptomyces sp.]|uniref:sigma-70 family RNA polymerase sigma factor n=1 Tax=Streptomyces sp. TaxID=1931 RepID=UPI002D79CB26|nr:sigma-70 family RNA polymerase sigma factor [Streptomyces sp.]HET6358298.1 sigma-70 family RNA polymerase sigma factor [Streptomyces sp.]